MAKGYLDDYVDLPVHNSLDPLDPLDPLSGER